MRTEQMSAETAKQMLSSKKVKSADQWQQPAQWLEEMVMLAPASIR